MIVNSPSASRNNLDTVITIGVMMLRAIYTAIGRDSADASSESDDFEISMCCGSLRFGPVPVWGSGSGR